MNLSNLLNNGYFEVRDIYSDWVFRVYDISSCIYGWVEPYHLKEEKIKDIEKWQKKIIVITMESELVPFNVMKQFVERYPHKFSLDENFHKQEKNIMNIKEKFILSLTSEPKKTFRRAGITDGDDLLTDEGQKVFLTWLLHSKFAEEFKKEVADELVENIKNKNENN